MCIYLKPLNFGVVWDTAIANWDKQIKNLECTDKRYITQRWKWTHDFLHTKAWLLTQHVEEKKADTKESEYLILSAWSSKQAKLINNVWSQNSGYIWRETVPGRDLKGHFQGSGHVLISWSWLWFHESVHLLKIQWVIY